MFKVKVNGDSEITNNGKESKPRKSLKSTWCNK